jgi:hypothetical protein
MLSILSLIAVVDVINTVNHCCNGCYQYCHSLLQWMLSISQVSHRQLRHHQLVTSLMLVTAPLQLRGGCCSSSNNGSKPQLIASNLVARAEAGQEAGEASEAARGPSSGINYGMTSLSPVGGSAAFSGTTAFGTANSSLGQHMDISGAEQMFASAIQLTKNNGDVVTTAALKRVRTE